MERLTEKITEKGTGKVLAYRLKNGCKNLSAIQQLGQYEDLQDMIGISFKEHAALCREHIPDDAKYPSKAIVLTDESVDEWNQYKADKEQGLLLRLPCKVGDTVYFLWRCSDETTIVHPAEVKEICIGTYMLRKNIKYKVEPRGYCGKNKIFYTSDWGDCIFTTQKEAEQALAEIKGE